MESKARVLQTQDCGSLLLARSRAPYVVGCLLPHSVLSATQLISTKLEAKVVFHKGQAAIELHVFMENGGTQHHMSYIVSFSEHHEFLRSLSEASALYLLTGTDHPVAYLDLEQPHAKTLYQRVNEGGLTIEVREDVRSQILLLSHFHAAMPSDHAGAYSASGC